MKILSADQSFTSTGWCLVANNKMTQFGVIKSDGTQDIYARAEYIALELVSLIKKHKPDVVRMEGLAYSMLGNSSKDLAGLLFVIITSIRRECKTEVELIAPTALKKFATGAGTANKRMMLDSLPQKVREQIGDAGYKFTTGATDITDAYFLARYVPDTYFK